MIILYFVENINLIMNNTESSKHNLYPPLTEISLKPNTKGYSWLLFNYGNIFYKSSEEQYYREIGLVRLSRKNYKIANWDINDTIVISIPETWSLFYPLGTIFNDRGFYLLIPEKAIPNQLYEREIILSNYSNYKDTSYFETLKDTRFPKPSNEESSNDPFFFFESKKNIQFIVPIDVIKRKFYYYSFKGIESIIKRKLDTGIHCLYHTKDLGLIEYDGDCLNKSDVKSIGKYLFTKEYGFNKDTGLSRLKFEVDQFYKRSLQRIDYNDIHFKIPFDQPLIVKVLGQYITDFNAKDPKFIVYQILEYKSFNEKVLFSLPKKIKVRNIKDKRSTINRDLKEEKITKSKIGVKKKTYSSVFDSTNATNSSIPSLNIELPDATFGDQYIDFEFIDRDDQDYKYATDKIMVNLSGVGTNSLGSYNSILEYLNISKKEKDTTNKINNEFFEVFLLTLEKLKEEGIASSLLYIDSDKDGYSRLKSHDNSIRLKMLIAKLNCWGQEYCLVEANSGYSIGMFKNEGTPLAEVNDHNLHVFLQNLINEYKFQWTTCYYRRQDIEDERIKQKRIRFNKILHSHRFRILSPMDHLSKPLDENIANLTNRISGILKKHK